MRSDNMKKQFFRVSYNNIGIYEALKNSLWRTNKMSIWEDFKKTDSFSWLDRPNKYNENCKSYFTVKGFEIFKLKTLPIMKKYLDEKLIIIENFEFNIIKENIIYKDEYQIVIEE